MTTARHRPVPASDARPPTGPGLKGKAPHGMWLVAWRQHRIQIAVTLGLIAVVIAGLIVLRERIVAVFTAAGCGPTGRQCTDEVISDLWRDSGFGTWSPLLQNTVVLAPIVLGVFVGAPIFTREFSRGTQVFALTQSVSRRRWWITKAVVAGVPLLVGLLALGFVTGWVDASSVYTAHAGFGTIPFMTRAILPAAHELVAFAIAVAAGIVTRSTVAALVSGLIVAGLVVGELLLLKPDVLPPTREITPIAATIQGPPAPSPLDTDPDAWYLDGGYLDAHRAPMPGASFQSCFQPAIDAGNKAVGIADAGASGGSTSGDGGVALSPQQQQLQNSPEFETAYNRALIDCARGEGIAYQYTDYLPGSMLWPLRWAMSGIAAALAVLFLLIGAIRLGPAVAKR